MPLPFPVLSDTPLQELPKEQGPLMEAVLQHLSRAQEGSEWLDHLVEAVLLMKLGRAAFVQEGEYLRMRGSDGAISPIVPRSPWTRSLDAALPSEFIIQARYDGFDNLWTAVNQCRHTGALSYGVATTEILARREAGLRTEACQSAYRCTCQSRCPLAPPTAPHVPPHVHGTAAPLAVMMSETADGAMMPFLSPVEDAPPVELSDVLRRRRAPRSAGCRNCQWVGSINDLKIGGGSRSPFEEICPNCGSGEIFWSEHPTET